MQDRVLLDENLAWLLFGGTQVEGMQIRIGTGVFSVAGVIEREKDFATQKAFPDEMTLFMRYDALKELDTNAGISCYEYVMADPVRNFAVNAAREKFPIGRGEILCNTMRFSYGRMMDMVLKFSSRSVLTGGILYPYWENAARILEDWSCLCCLFGTLLLAVPTGITVIFLVLFFRIGKDRFEEEYWPKARETVTEAVRIRQRGRWVRRHGRHEAR